MELVGRQLPMPKFFCVILLLLSSTTCAVYIGTTPYTSRNHGVVAVPHVDAFGGLSQLANQFLTLFYPRRIRHSEAACRAVTIAIAGSEFKITQRPRGHCPYCCPLTNPADHVVFYFTNKLRKGAMTPIRLTTKTGALKAAGVDPNLPTVIYIHGFSEHGRGVSARMMRDAYLSRPENYNVMLLDWGILSSFPWYPIAARNTKVVGPLLGQFLKFYDATGELPISKIHIVGFSLGSHVAGFAAKTLGAKRKLPRISALDPAFPEFSLTDTSQRISLDDAEYIDVIHTDGGAYGLPISVGHADFYPNGGSAVQPGCEFSKLSQRGMLDHVVLCSHFYAVYFYAESVRNPTGFPATKCGPFRNCRFTTHAYMGFLASKSTTLGNFYLTTNDHAPFARSAEEQAKTPNQRLP